MALENLVGADKFIAALVPSNPTGGDDKREGDDHIRGIKNTIKNTFPNINGAVTATEAELSSVANKVNRAGDTMTGALGIGTPGAPGAVLEVHSPATAIAVFQSENATGGIIAVRNAGGATVAHLGSALPLTGSLPIGDFALAAFTGKALHLITSDVSRLAVDPGGNVLIGHTDNSQNYKCNVQFNGGATNGLRVSNETGQGAPFLVGLTTNAPVSASDVALNVGVLGTGGTLFIRTNGNIQNLNNSYGAMSDSRLKTNVTDASPKLADLLKVRVVNYSLIAAPGQKQLGVIAQELQAIFPAMVEAAPIAVGGGAQSKEAPEEYLGVKYSVFVPILIKAVQELTARVEALEALPVP